MTSTTTRFLKYLIRWTSSVIFPSEFSIFFHLTNYIFWWNYKQARCHSFLANRFVCNCVQCIYSCVVCLRCAIAYILRCADIGFRLLQFTQSFFVVKTNNYNQVQSWIFSWTISNFVIQIIWALFGIFGFLKELDLSNAAVSGVFRCVTLFLMFDFWNVVIKLLNAYFQNLRYIKSLQIIKFSTFC